MKEKGYWEIFENNYNEAKKYYSRNEFKNNCQSAYNAAIKCGYLSKYNWFKTPKVIVKCQSEQERKDRVKASKLKWKKLNCDYNKIYYENNKAKWKNNCLRLTKSRREKTVIIEDLDNEIWKPIVGYETLYLVSNFGRVKSIDRYVNHKSGLALKRAKVLKQGVSKSGYSQVSLSKNNAKVSVTVHSLVMNAFTTKPSGDYEIDHINTIKTDNRLCNLRWVTHYENQHNPLTIQHHKDGVNKK